MKRLDLSLGQEQLIGLEGTVTSLTGARELDLLLRRLRLPLDRLNPYVRSFLPGVELGGLVELRDLRLRSNQAELEALTSPAAGAAPTLPRLSGLLRLSRVKATFSRESIAGMALGVGDLDIDLALTAGGAAPATPEKILEGTPDPSTPPDPSSLKVKGAPVALLGRLSLGSFKGAGARVRGLGLLISAGIGLDGGLQPGPAAARVALTIPSLKYTSQATGRLAMSVRASAAGWAQLRQRRAKLSYLDLDVSKLLRARLVADLKQWGKGSLNADLKLQPLDLARLLAWLPPKLRSPLGGARLAGAIDLQAGLSGRLPGSGPVRPLDLPLNITLNLGMKGVKLADKGREISAGPLDGAITVKGKPGDLDLSGKLALASLTKPDQSLTLTGLTLEPRVRLTRRKLDARLAVGLERAAKTDLGFSASSLHLDHHVTAALPMAKLLAGRAAPLGKTRAEATLKLAKQRMAMPANTLSLEGMEIRLTAGYAPSGGGTSTIRLETDLARVAHEEQDLLVSGLKLVFDDEITGHGGISLPSPRPHLAGLASRHGGTLSVASMRHGRSGATASGLKLKMSGDLSGFSLAGEKIEMDWVQHSVGAELASLALRGVVDRPLLNNRFDLELTMHKLKDLELGKLALRLPTRGVYLDMSGRGEDLIPLDTTRLPDFSLKLAAGLKNRAAKSEAESTFLYPGVRGAGKLGAELSLVSSGGDRLRLDGRLLADAFNLWQRGGVKGRSSRIELRGLNARMPFSQQLILRGGRFRLPRPERLLTAMSARSPLYHELRPYTRRAAGLTLGGLLFERQGARGTQRIRLDRAHLDLTLADNTLMMKRLYLKLFGGDIAGALQVQLLSLAPLDLTLQFKTQVTGVDLAYLNPEAIRFGQETEVSALLDFSYRPAREELAGRMEITKLSLKMLDSLLVYLDPDRTNESVQKNRRLLSAWYIRWINPSVQLVSLWIKHGNLNMDINMDAWFVVGTVLKRVLKNMRVRRLNVLPMLRQEVTPILRKLERSLGAKKVAEK